MLKEVNGQQKILALSGEKTLLFYIFFTSEIQFYTFSLVKCKFLNIQRFQSIFDTINVDI